MTPVDTVHSLFVHEDADYARIIQQLLGRMPASTPARFKGFGYCIQDLDETPRKIHDILSTKWPATFRSYVLVRLPKQEAAGRIIDVTREDMRILDAWHLTDLRWHSRVKIGTHEFASGKRRSVSAHVLGKRQSCGPVISLADQERGLPFLNEYGLSIVLTNQLRDAILREQVAS